MRIHFTLWKFYGTTQRLFPTPVGAIHESPEQGWILRKPNGETQPVGADAFIRPSTVRFCTLPTVITPRRGELCSPADGRGRPSLRAYQIQKFCGGSKLPPYRLATRGTSSNFDGRARIFSENGHPFVSRCSTFPLSGEYPDPYKTSGLQL